jgi:hypothetical protein
VFHHEQMRRARSQTAGSIAAITPRSTSIRLRGARSDLRLAARRRHRVKSDHSPIAIRSTTNS